MLGLPCFEIPSLLLSRGSVWESMQLATQYSLSGWSQKEHFNTTDCPLGLIQGLQTSPAPSVEVQGGDMNISQSVCVCN